MNKTDIEWTDFTWNPVYGCTHGCEYCYARELDHDFYIRKINLDLFTGTFHPRFYPGRLEQPIKRKKPAKVFIGSMTDMGGSFVLQEWHDQVMATVDKCPRLTFQTLTKRPDLLGPRLMDRRRENFWVGTTVEDQDKIWRIDALKKITTVPVRFISFEPLLGPIETNLSGIEWVIIGSQTGKVEVQPDQEWVRTLIDQARTAGAAVFYKTALFPKWGDRLKEYPCSPVRAAV